MIKAIGKKVVKLRTLGISETEAITLHTCATELDAIVVAREFNSLINAYSDYRKKHPALTIVNKEEN
jgi:hypothetical protein